MNDEKILDKIKQSANSSEVPESLKPENITDKLIDKSPKAHRRIYQVGGVIAAALGLVVGISAMTGNLGNFNNRLKLIEATMESAAVTDESRAGTAEFAEVFKQAGSYEDILSTMDEYEQTMQEAYQRYDGIEVIEEVAESESGTFDMPANEAGSSDHSTTNLQVEGVDEGDVVKTDGDYLYVISNNRTIRIIKLDGAKMSEVATVRIDNEAGEESIMEIYLANNKLNVITQGYGNGLRKVDDETYYMDYRATTSVYTYDLSKKETPKLLGKVSQDGDYNSSRKIGDYVYLFTSFYPRYMGSLARGGDNDYVDMVPYVGEEMIEPANIYLPIQPRNCSYMVISSMNLDNPDKIVDKKAILQDASDFYVTTQNIYVRSQQWGHNGSNTAIAKFSFQDGKITGESAGVVAGDITDTFSINEYNDTLRVLTTVWSGTSPEPENHVTVFDDKMNMIGKIAGLAKGETIYSARFMGELGYFVTYRNVDPLFAVDFSNPHQPEILSELKITGFSEYLHFYGADRLLGIGWETDPKTGEREGLKLSMFDISNPRNVTEINKTVVQKVGSFPGEYDYKALTVSPERNVIGLATYWWQDVSSGYNYMVFSYDEDKGFENRLAYAFAPDSSNAWEYEKSRGIYVDDIFYVIAKDNVFAFDMQNNYQKVGELLTS